MVKVCSYNYTIHDNTYDEYFNQYMYPLYDFQKWAIKAIVDGNHTLICAPTGSGKTLPGEFALDYFFKKGKKTIYTTPIKALSNEKFHHFTHKYPEISVGLITGDIKTNPDADVLIMTTEILLNKLYQINSSTPPLSSMVSFDMDINADLGCVVFDEIHMINDEHRGHVWEQCIMLLPSHIQMIGLSATLDNPEKFAFWLETKGDINKPIEKEVYLTKKEIRTVPLIHYSFITVNNSINKIIKDKIIQNEIKTNTNKLFVIQNEKNVFQDNSYQTIHKMLKLFEKHNVKTKRAFVLNNVAELLVEKEMLPALCYVFSRKQLEICAQEMTANLLEFDSKIPYIMDRECEQIIRKLPNFEEYLHLPEYVNLVKLLRKGVGIHHAGLMPILREMVELLFARGFIKILFCTETMSVGINLPVKTTIFTDIYKFNGEIIRLLYSHEYTQAAGRAGRLGLDTMGSVIHLNNLFHSVDSVSYKNMMNGKSQVLTSKFKISYNLLLNLLDIGNNNLLQFVSKSMVTGDIDTKMGEIYYEIEKLEKELDTMRSNTSYFNTPVHIIGEYVDLQQSLQHSINKKRKELERKIQTIKENYKHIENEKMSYIKIFEKEKIVCDLKDKISALLSYFHSNIKEVLTLLFTEQFICGDITDESSLQLTLHGKIASQMREIHCLTFSKLYATGKLENFMDIQLVSIFSCFTNIKVHDDYKEISPASNYDEVNEILNEINDLYNEYQGKESRKKINTGSDYSIQYDLINYVEKWCECSSVEECKLILQELETEKGIFLGEFVKAILKINNISSEFEKIAEFTGNIQFLSKLQRIPQMTLKYVVTNQSLYV
jgi:antiviral helicase SKI2